MNGFLQKMSMVVSVLVLVCWSVPCRAAETMLNEVLKGSANGGITGTLFGAAVMAFANKTGDQLDYMAYGAASGVLAGTAYGLGKAMLEVENGTVKWSLPAVRPDFKDPNSRGQAQIVFMAELLRGRF